MCGILIPACISNVLSSGKRALSFGPSTLYKAIVNIHNFVAPLVQFNRVCFVNKLLFPRGRFHKAA